jgi:hypothetical protein
MSNEAQKTQLKYDVSSMLRGAEENREKCQSGLQVSMLRNELEIT